MNSQPITIIDGFKIAYNSYLFSCDGRSFIFDLTRKCISVHAAYSIDVNFMLG